MWRLGASRGDGLRSARSTRSGSCTLVARLRTSRSCRGRRRERGYMFVYTTSLAFLEKLSGQPDTPHQSFLVLLPWRWSYNARLGLQLLYKECARD